MFAASASRRRPGAWVSLRRNLRRAFGREPNPLCRGVDRSRSRLLMAVLVGFLAATLVAVLVALTVLHLEQEAARRLAGHRHPVTATTVGGATDDPGHVPPQARAQAVWDYPPTGHNGGWVAVPAGTGSGSSLTILVDDRGNAASEIPRETDLAANAALAGFGSATAGWLLTGAGYAMRRRTLDRRAERTWEPEWEQVEPYWSGRNRRHPESGQQ